MKTWKLLLGLALLSISLSAPTITLSSSGLSTTAQFPSLKPGEFYWLNGLGKLYGDTIAQITVPAGETAQVSVELQDGNGDFPTRPGGLDYALGWALVYNTVPGDEKTTQNVREYFSVAGAQNIMIINNSAGGDQTYDLHFNWYINLGTDQQKGTYSNAQILLQAN